MPYIGLFSVESLKLVLFSIISYFVYIYLLKPVCNFIQMIIHYHGFHYNPKNWFFGHGKDVWPNFPLSIEMETVERNFYQMLLKSIGPNPSRSFSVVWISIFPTIIASGHKAVEIILHRKNLKRPYLYKFMGLGTGLIPADPSLWKVRRKLIEPLFTTKKMKDHFKNMFEEVELFSHRLDSEFGKPVDLEHQIHTSTLNIILKSTANIPLDDSIEDKRKLVQLVNTVEKNAVKRMANPFHQFDWTFKFSKFSQVYYKAIQDAVQIVNKIYNRRKQILKCSKPNEQETIDLIYLIEDKVDKQGLIDELITLIAAGHDTTAVSLRWLLFNLGNHLDAQEKLYQEIIQYFPDDTTLDDMDKINQCNYLDQCVKESLRLNPPVAGVVRVLEEDIMVKDKRLFKGSIVCVSITSTHRDPSVYPDPDKFDPDRWSPENASRIPKSAFIPFGFGPRVCIGYRYAMLELKIYTIQIIRRFSLRSTRKHGSIPILLKVTLQPALPLEIIMTPRNNNQNK